MKAPRDLNPYGVQKWEETLQTIKEIYADKIIIDTVALYGYCVSCQLYKMATDALKETPTIEIRGKIYVNPLGAQLEKYTKEIRAWQSALGITVKQQLAAKKLGFKKDKPSGLSAFNQKK